MQPKSSKRRRKEKKASSPPFIKPCLLSLFLFLGSVAEITKPNCKAQDKKKPKKRARKKVPPLYVACALLFCLPAVKKSCKKKSSKSLTLFLVLHPRGGCCLLTVKDLFIIIIVRFDVEVATAGSWFRLVVEGWLVVETTTVVGHGGGSLCLLRCGSLHGSSLLAGVWIIVHWVFESNNRSVVLPVVLAAGSGAAGSAADGHSTNNNDEQDDDSETDDNDVERLVEESLFLFGLCTSLDTARFCKRGNGGNFFIGERVKFGPGGFEG